MADTRTIYTVGSSTRTLDEFLDLLRAYGIELLIDVRRWPKSRLAHFAKDQLRDHLSAAGIGYHWLGEGLGGYRKGGYGSYLRTEEFAAGLRALERRACDQRTVVMCSERLPWRWHRRFIGDALHEQGWQVIHVIDEKRTWQPERSRGTGSSTPEEGTGSIQAM
jgi:uncharacterized protein (DUF488 family)